MNIITYESLFRCKKKFYYTGDLNTTVTFSIQKPEELNRTGLEHYLSYEGYRHDHSNALWGRSHHIVDSF